MSASKRDWLIATGYVALIFATLGVVRAPLASLRSHGYLRITISVLFFICLMQGFRVLLRNYPRNLPRQLIFLVLLLTYYVAAHAIKLPEEQLHFFEYGLVGIFFLRALRHYRMSPLGLFFSAWALSSAAGWCDELLQGITPNRHYDLRDVGFNIVASGLGLLAYLVCKKEETPR